MENKTLERDHQLDMYRGWIMIYIICWIHVLYWLNIPCEHKSYFLVEMPIIFFIAGASSRLARPKRFREIVINRFKRVFLPYYKYAIISTLLFGLYDAIVKQNLLILDLKQLLYFVLGIELPNVKFAFHTWFIFPYFVISIFPKSIFKKAGGGVQAFL